MSADILIVGGGIVGLAAAHAVQQRFPGKSVLLLEKEARLATHQTGRNSGVIHSGIYYKPGSFKAQFCKAGNASLRAFCEEHGIKFESCGKIVVATTSDELAQLEGLRRRADANGIPVRQLAIDEMRELEPHAAGIGALHVPTTGIVNFRQVALKLAELVRVRGGEIRCDAEVLRTKGGVAESTAGEFRFGQLINCAGLYSDRIARAAGAEVSMQIVPFRGEYYQLRPERANLVRGLIYPVPDPAFPFLGVHCTRALDGSVHLGPNAVLAFAREGYTKTRINIRDLVETLRFPGFWKLAKRHWSDGCQEMIRSLSRAAFVRSLQRLVPAITEDDVIPAEAGVRAQGIRRDGSMEDDFFIVRQDNAIHVCNAPSPAATASLEIGNAVASMMGMETTTSALSVAAKFR